MLKSETRFDHIVAAGFCVKMYNNPASGSPGDHLRKRPG